MTEQTLAVRQESTISTQRATILAREKIYAGIPDDDVELALAICHRYDLDPLLKHVQLIPSNKKDDGGKWTKAYSVYITRDGLLHVAHESAIPFAIQFDEPQAKTNPYSEKKDIYLTGKLKREGFPDLVAGLWFSEYQGTDKQGQPNGAWKTHPAAMHQKVVEVYLLRRGFDVSLPAYEEVQPDIAPIDVSTEAHAGPLSPTAANGNGGDTVHWIDKVDTRGKPIRPQFWAWAGQTMGLKNEQVYEALGVEHVHDFTGSMQDAKTKIEEWVGTQAKKDEAQQAAEELFDVMEAPNA